MDRVALARFLDALVRDESLYPIYDNNRKLLTTFCNLGAKRNGPGENFHEFDEPGLLADGMGRIMRDNKSGLWHLSSGAEAALWALNGRRAMGFMSSKDLGDMHGHIVRLYPKDMTLSGSLGHPVPWCVNIGRGDPGKPLVNFDPVHKSVPNWICKTSQAFPVKNGECLYYRYLG